VVINVWLKNVVLTQRAASYRVCCSHRTDSHGHGDAIGKGLLEGLARDELPHHPYSSSSLSFTSATQAYHNYLDRKLTRTFPASPFFSWALNSMPSSKSRLPCELLKVRRVKITNHQDLNKSLDFLLIPYIHTQVLSWRICTTPICWGVKTSESDDLLGPASVWR
jgi:hypothetical protein